MKAIKNIFISGCAILLLCQCATQDDVRTLNQQIRAVNQKVETVKTSTVTQMQRRQASSVNQIDQVSDEVVRIRSLIEESNHRNELEYNQLSEKLVVVQSVLEERMVVIEQNNMVLRQQVEQLSAGMENIQRDRIQVAEQRAREAAKRAEEARQRTVMAASGSAGFVKLLPAGKKIRVGSAPVFAAGTTGKVEKQPRIVPAQRKPSQNEVVSRDVSGTVSLSSPFEQAMKLFNKNKYKEAYQKLENMLADNPRGRAAPRILFYMGESLYRQGDYDLAILDYQKIISNHPKNSHVPAALLKQGISFEKLTDNETAKIIYRKLIKEHPGTPEAEKARTRQADL